MTESSTLLHVAVMNNPYRIKRGWIRFILFVALFVAGVSIYTSQGESLKKVVILERLKAEDQDIDTIQILENKYTSLCRFDTELDKSMVEEQEYESLLQKLQQATEKLQQLRQRKK